MAKSACDAGKIRCVAQGQACLLAVHAKAEKKGQDLDASARDKCVEKFQSCIVKLAAKEDGRKPSTLCAVEGATDLPTLEDKVQVFVADVVKEIDPNFPTFAPSLCDAGKKACMWKKASCLLNAERSALKKNVPVDAKAQQGCRAKFQNVAKPEKGCIAKLEIKADRDPTKPKTQCSVRHDGAAIQALEDKVDAFVTDAVNAIRNLP